MRLLLDTHVLIWTAQQSPRLSVAGRSLLSDPKHRLMFSPVSICEVAIKYARRRPDFRVDPRRFLIQIQNKKLEELSLRGQHTAAVGMLAPIHLDPFDRMLLAQAFVEQLPFVTADRTLSRYSVRTILI